MLDQLAAPKVLNGLNTFDEHLWTRAPLRSSEAVKYRPAARQAERELSTSPFQPAAARKVFKGLNILLNILRI